MKRDQQPRQGFEERLLTELKSVIQQRSRARSSSTAGSRMAQRLARRRTAWKRRVAVSTGIAAALVISLAVVLPTVGGEGARNQAYAVTEDDGKVTVEIRSIEDPEGLEHKLDDVGVPAAVHYMPAGKLCSLWGRDEQPPPPKPRHPEERDRAHVAIGQNEDGAYTFTLDREGIPKGQTLVIFTQYSAAEHGQDQEMVPSIAALWSLGDLEELRECRLVDGSVEGWPFQEGAPPSDPGDK
jgi:hypothetical protein